MANLLSRKSTVSCQRVTILQVASDRQLLKRFVAGDEAAFAELIRRHSALVMGVCQRILRNISDSEDAFQATFLVLSRKTKSVQWQESIAGWLHDTARRTAMKMRAVTLRRREIELQAAERRIADQETATANPALQVALGEMGEILDRELAGLPSRFREVFLLSQVEGLPRDEVAERLGVTVATVKDRLERGRSQLRSRLLRRGVTLTSAALAAWVVPGTVQAACLTNLATTTSNAAAAYATGTWVAGASPTATTLAQGVLKMMGFEKLKYATAWVLMVLTAGGIAFGMLQDEPKRFENGLRGHVVAVTMDKRPTVTIALEEFDTLLSLDVSAQAEVWVAFEKGTLGDLKQGQLVSMRLAGDHRTVNKIHVQGKVREASIQSIASSGKIVMVDDDDDLESGHRTINVELAPDAILRIGGLPADRSDLKPGMQVPLEFNRAGERVNAIEAEAAENTLIEGELLEVHQQENRLLVGREDTDDGPPARQSFSITGDTIILVDGKRSKLGDLKPGSLLKLRLADDLTSIRAVSAMPPELEVEPPDSDDK